MIFFILTARLIPETENILIHAYDFSDCLNAIILKNNY